MGAAVATTELAATEVGAPARRTYGNARRRVSAGIGPLGWLSSAVWLVAIVVVIVVVAVAGLVAGAVAFVCAGLLVATVAIRNRHHRTLLQRGAARAAWWRANRRGETSYFAGPLGAVPYAGFRLPGLAAGARASQWGTALGEPFVLIHHPSTNDYAVVIRTEPEGGSLVDEEQINNWVAGHGAVIARLGDEPGVVGAQAVLEAAPDGGSELARQIARRLDPDAHPVARAMLLQAGDTYPASGSQLRGWFTVTFTGAGRGLAGRRRDTAEVARDLATRLPGLLEDLRGTGAGAARPASLAEAAEAVAVAYDPDRQRLLDEARAAGEAPEIGWDEAGPVAAHNGWDTYRHGRFWSVSWVQSQPMRGVFHAQVLARLLGPHVDVAWKRVTLLYDPVPSDRAARIVEADKLSAGFRVQGNPRAAARAEADLRAAHQAAREEAQGAGLVNVGMIVTATVDSVVKLPAARSAIDYLAPSARLTLRVAEGQQAPTFLAGLPIGLHLQRHLRVPAEIREGM